MEAILLLLNSSSTSYKLCFKPMRSSLKIVLSLIVRESDEQKNGFPILPWFSNPWTAWTVLYIQTRTLKVLMYREKIYISPSKALPDVPRCSINGEFLRTIQCRYFCLLSRENITKGSSNEWNYKYVEFGTEQMENFLIGIPCEHPLSSPVA